MLLIKIHLAKVSSIMKHSKNLSNEFLDQKYKQMVTIVINNNMACEKIQDNLNMTNNSLNIRYFIR